MPGRVSGEEGRRHPLLDQAVLEVPRRVGLIARRFDDDRARRRRGTQDEVAALVVAERRHVAERATEDALRRRDRALLFAVHEPEFSAPDKGSIKTT